MGFRLKVEDIFKPASPEDAEAREIQFNKEEEERKRLEREKLLVSPLGKYAWGLESALKSLDIDAEIPMDLVTDERMSIDVDFNYDNPDTGMSGISLDMDGDTFAITLWHNLGRVSREQDFTIYDGPFRSVPPPKEIAKAIVKSAKSHNEKYLNFRPMEEDIFTPATKQDLFDRNKEIDRQRAKDKVKRDEREKYWRGIGKVPVGTKLYWDPVPEEHYNARTGSRAVVSEPFTYKRNRYINIKWIRDTYSQDQGNGGYHPEDFILLKDTE